MTNDQSPSSDAGLDSILAELIEAEERTPDQVVDISTWTQKYPKYAEQIRSFLANRGKLEAVVGPRGVAADEAPTIGVENKTGESAPGQRIRYFGDYELLEEIAQGGMGVVWKARQTSLKRDVALKLIRAGSLAGPEEVERFLREAEAAANLQHPNIVAIHEVGEHEGQHYFTMDYIAGRDLGAMVKDGPLPQQAAARYVKIIAEAIHFAHQRGTLHRDLKPQNVIIDGNDQPRITDFGLAKLMKDDSHLTQTGVVMGSPSYMPPEQASGRQADIGPASDVYSLGAMLYELLTGKPPFRASTALATMIEVMEKEPTAPRKLRAEISPDLETVCLKCLEKSSSARYPTARALAEELDRYLKGEPILAKPASAVRKVVSWARRHPGTLSAVAALIMVALAFGVLYLFEENAFLLAKQANPTLARVPGLRHEAFELWRSITQFAFIAGMYLFVILQKRSRGLPAFKDWFNSFKHMYTRPLQPLGERTRIFAIGASLVLIGYGVMLLVTWIQARVWEGESISVWIVLMYFSIYFPFATLGLVIQDYRLVHYGSSTESSQQLTAEQLEPIRCALTQYDLTSAIKCYRETVPDVGKIEAKRNVMRLYISLYAENPGQFVRPSLWLAKPNWNVLLRVVLVEVIILGVMWFMMPPTHPSLAIVQFAISFLFGMAVIVGMRAITYMRVKEVWKLLLLLLILNVPLIILGTSLLSLLIGPCLCGVLSGAFLMGYASIPWR